MMLMGLVWMCCGMLFEWFNLVFVMIYEGCGLVVGYFVERLIYVWMFYRLCL